MWEFDVAINTAKAALPFQATLRRMVRARRGYPITSNAPLALSQGLQQIDDLRALRVEIAGRTVLDLGSGWHPIVPLLYRIAGARAVHLTDADRLMDAATLAATSDWLSRQVPEIAGRLGLPEEAVIGRADAGTGPLDRMLARLGMTYHVPFASSKMPAVDIVVSRVVLEHIEPTVLARLHRDFALGLRPGGIVAHIVDNSDHREHRDKRLSRIDFLRYQERAWRLFCLNPQDYCNRLRHSDHVRLLSDAGFELLLANGEVDSRALADALTLNLAEPWRDRPIEDLATTTSRLVGRALGRGGGTRATANDRHVGIGTRLPRIMDA